jgi:CheY-like chemotaxis protein
MGRRVLLVEDEYLFATRIADEFGQLGVEAVGPAGSVEQALELVEHNGHLDAAVLDINLLGDVVYPVAGVFRARGVPFVFVTGYEQQPIPGEYRNVVRFRKPIVRIPAKATSRSDAWRPPVPIDGDQGGVRAPLGEVGHLRY